jgi:hypothetical protein
MKKVVLVFLLVSGATPALGQETRPTPENWMSHPEIRAIRELYQGIEANIESGIFSAKHERSACKGEYFDATFFEDSLGVVRKYAVGTSSTEAAYYYDGDGTLRFVFQSIKRYRGTHKEARYYYDRSGRELYTDERLLEGRDAPVRYQLEVSNPREAFDSLCPLPEPGVDIRITDIQARLFCELSGEFTQDVIGDTFVVLHNTVAGGGEAGCASRSTLALVVVQTPANAAMFGRVFVSVLAESTTFGDTTPDTLALNTVDLWSTGNDGLYSVPLFLYDTGCRFIHLTAWVEGARSATERKETINFVCGE